MSRGPRRSNCQSQTRSATTTPGQVRLGSQTDPGIACVLACLLLAATPKVVDAAVAAAAASPQAFKLMLRHTGVSALRCSRCCCCCFSCLMFRSRLLRWS